MTLYHSLDESAGKLEVALCNCVAQENNQNFSPMQKEMLCWHWRLGHANMATVRWLATQGLLGKLSKKLSRVVDTPMCATCQCGKQVQWSTATHKEAEHPKKVGGVTKDKLEPGQEVTCDQFEVKK